MMLFSDPSFLSSVGQVLVVLGLVGQVSLFFFPEGRRILERSLGVMFTVLVVGGAASPGARRRCETPIAT